MKAMSDDVNTPVVAIVMGDAAGIGPELVIHTLENAEVSSLASFVVLGNLRILQQAADALHKNITFQEIDAIDRGNFNTGKISVLDCDVEENTNIRWGVSEAINGTNAITQMKKAVELAVANIVDGVVIAPLNKEAMLNAGFQFPDEIAFLGSLTNAHVKTVVTWNNIYRSSVTGHVSLREVADLVTRERIVPVIENLSNAMKDLGVESPQIGVAALNPHAGEGGAFGDEEIREITPAIEIAQKMGIDASGPHPADTIFVRAMKGDFNGVVFQYHDQGNISMHAAAFGEGVMIYSGLPFPCAGPTHGTAYDIAGQGKADPTSFNQATKMVCQLSRTLPTSDPNLEIDRSKL
jgi:4-hydroxythreonine-4-phosphate dehydrogenase